MADVEDELLLFRAERRDRHAFIRHDTIIAKSAAAMTLIVWPPSIADQFVSLTLIVVRLPIDLFHALVPQILEHLRFLLLLRAQALHQLQAEIALFVQDLGAFPFAGVDDVGLCAGEGGGEDDLWAFEEAGDVEVVAVEEPAPGLRGGRRGRAKEEEIIGVFVHDVEELDDFAEEVVYSHGGECFFVAFW